MPLVASIGHLFNACAFEVLYSLQLTNAQTFGSLSLNLMPQAQAAVESESHVQSQVGAKEPRMGITFFYYLFSSTEKSNKRAFCVLTLQLCSKQHDTMLFMFESESARCARLRKAAHGCTNCVGAG